MPDNPRPKHPTRISRRDAFRAAWLSMVGLATSSDADLAAAFATPRAVAETFVPDNNYPTFADEPAR